MVANLPYELSEDKVSLPGPYLAGKSSNTIIAQGTFRCLQPYRR